MPVNSIALDVVRNYSCVAIKLQRKSLPDKFALLGGYVRKIWFLLVFGLFLAPAFGQFSANVQGTVTDPNGAVVVGAKVTLTNTDTNVSQTFESNSTGQYYFNRLAPGQYTVTVSAPNFQTTVQPVIVTTDQTAGVDIRLNVGSATNSVTVTAEDSHGINTDETRLQYTLSSREIEEFPLQNESTFGLIKTAPGATGISENHHNINTNQDQASESVNGRGSVSNIYTLDSIPFNSEFNVSGGSGGVDFVPHPDMIEEVSLQTTTFSVENGASTGLQASITTKSGANKFHGDADYQYSGQPLEATPNFATSKPLFRSQEVSGALGGPIWKDRTFFFGSYFNQQYGEPNIGLTQFVDPQFINWANDSANALTYYTNAGTGSYPLGIPPTVTQGLLPVLKNRATSHATPVASGNILAPQGGGDWIDGGACAPGSGMTPLVPCNIPYLSEDYLTAPQNANGAQYNFRLDQAFRQGLDRAYLSFFRFDQQSDSIRMNPIFDGLTPSTGYYVAGNYTHAFSSSVLNEASFGLTRFSFDYKVAPYSVDQLELPFHYGPFEGGNTLQIAFLERELEHQAYGRDLVSWVKGEHNFSFGFQGSFQNELRDNSQGYGRLFYEDTFNLPAYLNDQAQYENNYTLSAGIGTAHFVPQVFAAGVVRVGLFAQDAWKVSPNLLITYGIRWDDFGNPSPYSNGEAFANIKIPGGPLLQAVPNISVGAVNNVYASPRVNNYLPRGAFAYTLPKSSRTTLIHGGVGLYQDDLNLEAVCANIPTQAPIRLSLQTYPFSPFIFGNSTVEGPAGGNPYGFSFPVIQIASYSSKGAPLDPTGAIIQGNDLYGVDPNLRAQSSLIYNIGIERELAGHLVLGALYSGSHSYNQLVNSNVNTLPGITATSNPNPNSDFGFIKYYRNAGVANYNALIATARQTVGRLTYQASYTLGVAKSDPGSNLGDQINVHSQYTYAGGDTRQRFTLTQVYGIPTHFRNSVLSYIVGGWNLNNTLVAQTGTPFSAQDANNTNDDYNQDGTSGDTPIYLGSKKNFGRSDAHQSEKTHSSVFPGGNNIAGYGVAPPTTPFSFATPLPGTEGSLTNIFRGPGYFSLDTGLHKQFAFGWFGGEKATFTARLDFSNLLNIANFQNPDGEFDDATFGQISGANQGRVAAFGGRLQF